MLPFLLLGVLIATPVWAEGREGAISPLILYVDYQHESPDGVQREMQREVGSLISPIGLPVEWKALAAMNDHKVSIALAVVHFRGNCDVTDLSLYPPYPFTLGRTAVSDGVILPFTDIYCNAIRAFMAPQLRSQALEERTASFGRAVGRVVAHELYHIFAHTKRHGSHGLAEPAWPLAQLTAPDFRFSQKDMQALRAGMMQPLLQSNGVVGKSPLNTGKAAFIRSGCLGCHGADGRGTEWGPSLDLIAKPYNSGQLRLRLNDTGTLMYQRARQLGVMWPSLTDTEIADLTAFLEMVGR